MNKTSNKLIFLTALVFLAVIISSSKNVIYALVGCWPAYGDYVIWLGIFGTFIIWLVFSAYLAKRFKWTCVNNNILRNLVGYSGGLTVSMFFIVFAYLATKILLSSFFAVPYGFVSC